MSVDILTQPIKPSGQVAARRSLGIEKVELDLYENPTNRVFCGEIFIENLQTLIMYEMQNVHHSLFL